MCSTSISDGHASASLQLPPESCPPFVLQLPDSSAEHAEVVLLFLRSTLLPESSPYLDQAKETRPRGRPEGRPIDEEYGVRKSLEKRSSCGMLQWLRTHRQR